MTASDPIIEMMELADLAQPRKIAWEIHKQLRTQYGSVPHQVPLEGIARAVGIVAVEEFDTDRFEGTLVVKGNNGAIGLRRGLIRGRRNFTLGHELGHFLNPWHRTVQSKFECSKTAVAAQRTAGFDQSPPLERIEVEANEFAAALLLPLPEYRAARRKLGTDVDVAHIRALADTFAVSQKFITRTYVDQADSKIAVIRSHNGLIHGFTLPKEFPYLGLKRGDPLPRESLSHDFRRRHGEGKMSNLLEIRTSVWLEQQGAVSSLYEQVVIQRDGWATTLLMVDEEEADDEADDRNWNRRNFRG